MAPANNKDDTPEKSGTLSSLMRNPWFQGASALGVILGILGFIIGLPPISEMAFGKRASLTLDVVSEIPVFAVRQPVPGLSVTLNSRDLTSSRQDLIAARLRIRNNGELSVNERNTTNKDPLGFTVFGGQVVRLYDFSATSDHLRKLGSPRSNGNTFLLPPGLIIDPNDYVQFDLLIVKPVGKNLRFTSSGKVEGLRQILVSNSTSDGNTKSSLYDAVAGNGFIQLIRLVTYPFMAIALVSFTIIGFTKLRSLREKQKKRKRQSMSLQSVATWHQEDPKLRRLVPKLYVAIGESRLKSLADKEREEREHARQEESLKEYKLENEDISDFDAADYIAKSLSGAEVGDYQVFNMLSRLKMVGGYPRTMSDELRSAINSFVEHMENSQERRKIKAAEPRPGSALSYEYLVS